MDTEKAWQAVLDQLQVEMPKASFDARLQDTAVVSFEDGKLIIGVRNSDTQEWLESRLLSTIKRFLAGMMNQNVEVQFVVSDILPSNEVESNQADQIDDDISLVPSDPTGEISEEDQTLLDRVIVVSGYCRRLGVEIGAKAMWIYVGFRQMLFAKGERRRDGRANRKISKRLVARWAYLSNGAFWRQLANSLHDLNGLVECADASPGKGRVSSYFVNLTPRLTRADAFALYQYLEKRMKEMPGGLLDALRELNDMQKQELLSLLPPETEICAKPIELQYMTDIVRALLGIEEALPVDLEQAANIVHRKIVGLWGNIYISHYFILKGAKGMGLTPAQAWLVTLARDMGYINWKSQEAREEISFPGGYGQMAALIGFSPTSWKNVRAWFDGGKTTLHRGGDLSPFMRKLEPAGSDYLDRNSPLRFWVSVANEPVIKEESNGSSSESNGGSLIPSAESIGGGEESNGGSRESNGGAFKALKPPQITPKINSPTTNHPPHRFDSAAVDLPSLWQIENILKINRVSAKTRQKLALVHPANFISWLLFACSRQGTGINRPLNFAISQILQEPERSAGGNYDTLANLPPSQLLDLIIQSGGGCTGNLAWDNTMGEFNNRARELLPILVGNTIPGG